MVLSNKEWLDKMDEIISAIQNGGGDSQVIEDMLSNMWISSATYNVGDYVLYNNNIWKCLVQNSNIAPSEGTTWTRVNITSEISTLNSNLEVEDITSKCTIKDEVTNAKIIKYGKLVYVYFEISCTGSTTNVISGLPYCISNYYISNIYSNESPYMPMQSSAWVVSSKVDIYTKENIQNGYVSFSYICK